MSARQLWTPFKLGTRVSMKVAHTSALLKQLSDLSVCSTAAISLSQAFAADVSRFQQKKAAQESRSKDEMKRILVKLFHYSPQ